MKTSLLFFILSIIIQIGLIGYLFYKQEFLIAILLMISFIIIIWSINIIIKK